MKEFLTSSDGIVMITEENGNYTPIKPGDPCIRKINTLVREQCPQAHNRLLELYGNQVYTRVLRFMKCNFSIHDSTPDLVGDKMNFEYVPCPMRGECKDEGIICNPVVSHGLRVREIEVLQLMSEGYTDKETATKLFLSVHTVITYRKSLLVKLACNNKAQLTSEAYKLGILKR